MRTVCVWHHLVGEFRHPSGVTAITTPTNSKTISDRYPSNGEGWQQPPRPAARSLTRAQWWELDITWFSIWVMKKLGLA